MRRKRLLPIVLLSLLLPAVGAAASSTPPTDRSIKLDLIAKLKQSPQLLILGDSRGRQAEPSYLKRLTGHTAFNAAVMGGTAPEAWVFIRYTADRFPGQKRRYIWFVSSGLAGNIIDPRTQADPRGAHYLQEIAPYLSHQPDKVPWPKHPFTGYRPDGGLATKAWPPSATHVREVKTEAATIAAQIRRHPPTPANDPKRHQLFEHLLGYLNGRGERPVIVFNPIYPTIYTALKRYDNTYLTAALRYLHGQQSRYQFAVVNCENIYTCGGNATNWANPSHVDRFNMQRMLQHIITHSDGTLK
jgi:hypothetical protein